MNTNANVKSIESLAAFRLALIRFGDACSDGIVSLQLESRRAAEWVEVEQVNYWPAESRRANDDHKSAQINLERCELAIRPEDRKSCYEEKKAVEQAKQRMRLCEEQVRVVRKWAQIMNQETRDFHGDLSRLEHFVESDLTKAVAMMSKMILALERYSATTTSPPPQERSEPSDS